MPTSQMPLLLIDNVLDTIVQYPTATLLTSSEATGREAMRVADYRRDRSGWQPASAGERPHWNLGANTIGGSGSGLKAQAAFVRVNTSHTFTFLARMTSATAGQVLLHAGGAANFSLWRNNGGALSVNNNGTQRNFGGGAPTDDAWHVVTFVFDGATSLCRVFVDTAQVGADIAWVPQGIDTTGNSLFIGASTSLTLACGGLLGTMLYYSAALSNATVAANATALLAGNAPSAVTLVHRWEPLWGQGTQAVTDTQSGFSLWVGTGSAIEPGAPSEPLWGGGHWVGVDAGAIAANKLHCPDFLYIDRGHNLWGQIVIVEAVSTDQTFATGTYTDRGWIALAIPALDANGNFVVGGDPTVGFCVTEEGAVYTIFQDPVAMAARQVNRAVRVRFLSGSPTFVPQVTGIMLGVRTQLLGYSSISDDDEGARRLRTEESDAGYLATGRVYAYRTAQVSFTLIGDTEYDGNIRRIRRLAFEQNQPWLLCLNYGFYPQRMWLFQSTDTKWSAPKKTVYRDWRMMGREVGAAVL